MHLDAGARTFRERVANSLQTSFCQEKILERDRARCRPNPFKHRRENLFSVLQDRDFVSREGRRSEQLPHRSHEGVIARRVIRPNRGPDLLFVLEKIPDDHDRQGAT